MELRAPIDFLRYGGRLWWLMLATVATGYSAKGDALLAFLGFLFWGLVYFACWRLRLRFERDESQVDKKHSLANLVAMLGLGGFLLELLAGDWMAGLLLLLYAGLAALFCMAERRSHVLMLLGACLAIVLFAAAESRSALFLPCALWFAFAALGLLTVDFAWERERHCTVQQTANRGYGGTIFPLFVFLLVIPLYLFLPKPDGLKLGGMEASTANDYRDVEQSDQSREQDAGGWWGDLNERSEAYADYGDEFAIDDIRRNASLGNALVMFVESNHKVYLRGKTFDRFEDDRWKRDEPVLQRHELQEGYWEPGQIGAGRTEVIQRVEVMHDLDKSLYFAPGLQKLRFPGVAIYESADGSLELPRALRANTLYSAESRLDIHEGRYVLAAEEGESIARYLQLPAATSTQLRQLAHEVTAEAYSDEQKALALETHLRSSYQYSFETIIPYQGVTPLDWFLFDEKRGHCEFFASAMVVMLRSVGVPARLATGFSLGEKNPVTGFYEVRALDGHAWVEAYIEGMGWMMFEPTAFYPLPLPQSEGLSNVASELDEYIEQLAQESQHLSPGTTKALLLSAIRDVWKTARHIQGQIAYVLTNNALVVVSMLLLLALMAAVTYCMFLVIRDLRSNRKIRAMLYGDHTHGHEVENLAEALEMTYAARDLPRPVGQTFAEYCLDLNSDQSTIPEAFVERFNDIRYGPRGDFRHETGLYPVIEDIERALRKQPCPSLSRARLSLTGWLAEVARKLPFRPDAGSVS